MSSALTAFAIASGVVWANVAAGQSTALAVKRLSLPAEKLAYGAWSPSVWLVGVARKRRSSAVPNHLRTWRGVGGACGPSVDVLIGSKCCLSIPTADAVVASGCKVLKAAADAGIGSARLVPRATADAGIG